MTTPTDAADVQEQRIAAEEAEAEEAEEFDAAARLMKISGSDYLPVAARVAWFRHDHPDGKMTTELVDHERGGYALFRAEVRIPDRINPNDGTIMKQGGGATGWGSETQRDFNDYLEKAETKALGRALSALGYGTGAIEDGSAAGRPVDAPIDRSGQRSGGQARNSGQRSGGGADQAATPRQIQFIESLVRELNLPNASAVCEAQVGAPLAKLNRRDASVMVERLQIWRQNGIPEDVMAKAHAAATAAAAPAKAPTPIRPQPSATAPAAPAAPEAAAPLTSGFPWPQVAEAANLGLEIAAQKQQWREDVEEAAAAADGPDGDGAYRLAIGIAVDVTSRSAEQYWRFIDLATYAPNAEMLFLVQEAAERLQVFTRDVVQAVGKRRHQMNAKKG